MKIFKTKFEIENDAYLMLDLCSDKNKYGWIDNCVEVTFDQAGCTLTYLLKNANIIKKFARYERGKMEHIGHDSNVGLPKNSETI